MKYLFLLNRHDDSLPAPGTPESDQLFAEYGAAVAARQDAPCFAHGGAVAALYYGAIVYGGYSLYAAVFGSDE